MAERRKAELRGVVDRVSVVSGLGGPADRVFWEGYSHQEMWGMVMRSRPDELFERVQKWHKLAEQLEASNVSLQRELSVLLRTWQGPAAAAAAASQQKLLGWAQDAATRASTISTQLAGYGNALVDARLRMPQPQHRQAEMDFRAGEGAKVQDGVVGAYKLLQLNSDRLPTELQRREAKNEAVRVMQRLENDAVAAERAMPRFDPPPAVTAAPDPAPPPGPGRAAPGATPLPSPPPDPGPWLPPATDPQVFEPGAATTPAAVSLTGPGTGQGVADPGGRPWYGGGSGPLGGEPPATAPFRGGQGALAEPPAPGMGPGGKPVGAPGIPPRPGTGGQTTGVMPGAANSRGDEDKEKPLADYLEGPDDVFSPGRPAYPPVLGA
jgi:uncharacterized protein YukE